MLRNLRLPLYIWLFVGLTLMSLTHGHGLAWNLVGILICMLGFAVLLLVLPSPTAEEEARKNAEWLAKIDQDYKRVHSIEDRLDELERLKRRDMITPEEYTAKRQEILKDL